MKKGSFLVSVLAIASATLLVIGICLGIAIGFNCIEATNETDSMIKMCCASGIIGLAIAAITAGLQYQTKNLMQG